ncbi:MAG TPA: hypothetical protein DCQ90_00365 [Erysipelotrichaceae bacterium]|nr:MAG: hypothetical protein A2Y19_09900 [Firmicutes bacterium GWE2_51_13]HAO60428.1 hypothetical protein [Erysipelotrichaceae bacterium]
MKLNFITKIKNGKNIVFDDKFIVCLSGQKITLLNRSNFSEIAYFSGLKYTYDAQISPDGSLLLAKSNQNNLLIYSLDKLVLIKKIPVGSNCTPGDNGFTFSETGEYFYNIITREDLCCELIKYSTETFEPTEVFFRDQRVVINDIVYSKSAKKYLLNGYERSANNSENNQSFILWFDGKSSFERINIDQFIWNLLYAENLGIFILYEIHGKITLLDDVGRVIKTFSICSSESKAMNFIDIFTPQTREKLFSSENQEKLRNMENMLLGSTNIQIENLFSITLTDSNKILVVSKNIGLTSGCVEFYEFPEMNKISEYKTKEALLKTMLMPKKQLCLVSNRSCQIFNYDTVFDPSVINPVE